METTCMKCRILFSEKSKKNIIKLSSAEFDQVKFAYRSQNLERRHNDSNHNI